MDAVRRISLKLMRKGAAIVERCEDHAHNANLSVVGRQTDGAVNIGLDAGTFKCFLKPARSNRHDLLIHIFFARIEDMVGSVEEGDIPLFLYRLEKHNRTVTENLENSDGAQDRWGRLPSPERNPSVCRCS